MNRGVIEIDRFKLGYKIEGYGKPALVIGSSIYYPRTFSEKLRENLQLIFVDHRGFANGPEIDCTTLTIDTIIQDIESIRKDLRLDNFVIIGHSGHAYMALEYAKKYPNNVSHVILIAVGPDQSPANHEAANKYFEESVCPERKLALTKNLANLPKELEAFPEKRFIPFCLRLGARSWFDYNFDASYLWQDVYVNMPIIDRYWGEIFRDIDITDNLKNFDIPVLLCLGKFDYLVATFYSWHKIRDKFKNLKIRFFEKSGHTPQLEEAELFDQEVLDFICLK